MHFSRHSLLKHIFGIIGMRYKSKTPIVRRLGLAKRVLTPSDKPDIFSPHEKLSDYM